MSSQLQVRRALLLPLAAAAMPSMVHAHHSFAMYDSTKLVDIVGTVKEFQWTNPHVILWVTRDTQPGAEPELWTIELPTSTGNLSRMDWSKRSLAAGDRVKVEINPLRDGQHGGSFKKVTIEATGKVLTASPPAATAAAPGANATTPGPSPNAPDVNAKAQHSGPTPNPSAPPNTAKGDGAAAPNPAPAASAKAERGCACVEPGRCAASATHAWLSLIPLWLGLRRRAGRLQR